MPRLITLPQFAPRSRFRCEGYRDYLETADLMILSMRLADTPCSPIKYNGPARLIKELFSDAVR